MQLGHLSCNWDMVMAHVSIVPEAASILCQAVKQLHAQWAAAMVM